jgi:hypothetical protein
MPRWPQGDQPLHLARRLFRTDLEIEMDPILAGLRLRYPLEIKPRPHALGITACSNIPECPSAIDFDNVSGLQVAKTKQMIHDIAVIFHLVVQRFGPETGLGVWVAGVEGHLQLWFRHDVIVARTDGRDYESKAQAS